MTEIPSSKPETTVDMPTVVVEGVPVKTKVNLDEITNSTEPYGGVVDTRTITGPDGKDKPMIVYGKGRTEDGTIVDIAQGSDGTLRLLLSVEETIKPPSTEEVDSPRKGLRRSEIGKSIVDVLRAAKGLMVTDRVEQSGPDPSYADEHRKIIPVINPDGRNPRNTS